MKNCLYNYIKDVYQMRIFKYTFYEIELILNIYRESQLSVMTVSVAKNND